MTTFPRVTLLLLLLVGLAPSTAQAQPTLNYTTCIAQLDQIVAEIEAWATVPESGVAWSFSTTVPPAEMRPPQVQVQQNITDYSYTTRAATYWPSSSQTAQVFPAWEFAIVRSGDAFSCAFRKTASDPDTGGTLDFYGYSLPLSSVSEINRWHSAYVRTTRHLERLLAR